MTDSAVADTPPRRSPPGAALTRRTTAAIREVLAGRRRGNPLLFVGPAMVASIAYIDPGNFATNIQAGAATATRCCGSCCSPT